MMYSNIGLTCHETLPLNGMYLFTVKPIGPITLSAIKEVSNSPSFLHWNCRDVRRALLYCSGFPFAERKMPSPETPHWRSLQVHTVLKLRQEMRL